MKFAMIAAKLIERSPLSQRKIADRCGVGQGTVSRWLSGQSVPDLESAVIIADLLGVSLDELAGRVQPDPDRDYLEELITQHGPREIIRRVLSSGEETGCPSARIVAVKDLTAMEERTEAELVRKAAKKRAAKKRRT